MLVMAIGGMQYYSNATLWNRLSQLLYANDEISKGLYASVLPLGSVRKLMPTPFPLPTTLY